MKTALIVIVLIVAIMIVLYLIFIGNAKKPEPRIVKLDKPIRLIGLEIKTSDKAIYKDIGKVAAKFNAIRKKNPIPHLKEPWAAVNISKDYDPVKKTFTCIVGDVVTKAGTIPPGLQYYEIPAIPYAVFPISPKSKIAWGITMGRMKRFIYLEWLPGSGYEPSDLIGDFELHDDRSLGKRPEISLYVALKEKQ
ncbi:MAG: GyrI-like domain-containing protein [Bacteroidales bacterium]|jgi:predicted transcriptional regulator YdeE